MRFARMQAWVLRVVGGLDLLAFGALFLPPAWLEAAHGWSGLGEAPHGPVYECLVRQMSLTCGLLGAALWVLASDVKRYRPLVTLAGAGYLLAGPAVFGIDLRAGLPWGWAAGNGGACLLVGTLLLVLQRAERRAARPPLARRAGSLVPDP